MLMRCVLTEAVGIWFHPVDLFFGFLSYFCAISTTMLKNFKWDVDLIQMTQVDLLHLKWSIASVRWCAYCMSLGFGMLLSWLIFFYARLYSLKLEETKVKWNFKLYVCFLRWGSLWLLNPTGSYLHKALLTGFILAYKNSYIVYVFFFFGNFFLTSWCG